MLKKLTEYYNEDGEKIDITDEKIYWDAQNNQFRHKFKCFECNKPLGCMCYDTLLSALTDVEDGLICEDCGISNALNEASANDLIYKFDEERMKKVYSFVDSLMRETRIKAYTEETGIEKLEWSDKLEIISDGDEEKLKDFIISLMTDAEKMDEWYNTCDVYSEGESCNI